MTKSSLKCFKGRKEIKLFKNRSNEELKAKINLRKSLF